MTTLATKSGSLITKNSVLALNCNCCVSFGCLSQCPPDSLFVTVEAEDYINRYKGRITGICGSPLSAGLVSYFPGDQYNGTFELQRVSPTLYEYVYDNQVPDCESHGGNSSLSFNLTTCQLLVRLRMFWETDASNWPTADTLPKEIADLDCQARIFSGLVICPNSLGVNGVLSNHTGAYPNTKATSEGFGGGFDPSFPFYPLTPAVSRNCASLGASPPPKFEFTLPSRWWVEGSFTGFTITTFVSPGSTPPLPEEVELSGSRDISIFISPSGNPLP